MDSILTNAKEVKRKEKLLKDMMASSKRHNKWSKSPSNPPSHSHSPTYSEVVVAQPRAHRAKSIDTITSWPEGPENEYAVQKPYSNPCRRGMAEFPKLSPTIEGDFNTDSPARDQSPFHPHLPYIVDAKALQEAVNKDAQFIFKTICRIIEDQKSKGAQMDQLRADIEHYTGELRNVKENWMDVNQQLLVSESQLTDSKQHLTRVQTELTNTRHLLGAAQQQLVNAQSQLKAAEEDLNYRQLDWTTRTQRYEELIAIGSAKQVLLWKYIERLNAGVPPGPKGFENFPTPSMTGTQLTPGPPTSPNSDHSDSTITDFKGSPVRGSLAGSPERGGFQGGLEQGLAAVSFDKVKGVVRGSLARSPERGGFNPAASAFIPGASSPTKSIVSVASTSSVPPPPRPQTPQEDVLSLVLSLPARFYGICPKSLCASMAYQCTIPSCRLQHVCEAYNDENGNGCNDKNCRFVHEYRSCEDEVEGFRCRFAHVAHSSAKRKGHMEKKAHQHFVSNEEWKARVTVAGLRNAHFEAKY
ncbi:uncharacterized protein PAC_11651 [Phialocephala subalpina]|uniref:Uncharacterized protein n=1 Tax=Phialocephala subalpina TaxID=576137 RepID=A0A1L7X9Q7_9HELO|nr:uncharacterized protein PAC_11651 [Phialocephala subalpina]